MLYTEKYIFWTESSFMSTLGIEAIEATMTSIKMPLDARRLLSQVSV